MTTNMPEFSSTISAKMAYGAASAILIVAALAYFALRGNLPFMPERSFTTCADCNLIMISLSNVGANHMSMYGYERMTTPRLDAWAKDAVVFNNMFVTSSWTLPVATSLFTGLYPYSHEVLDRGRDGASLKANLETLPEMLRDRGYRTAAFTGGLDYSLKNPHMKGFEIVDEARTEGPADLISGTKEFSSTLQKALGWIKKNSGDKFFLFLHGYNAHCPFVPSEDFRGTFSGELTDKVSINPAYCYRGYETSDDGKTVVNFRRLDREVENVKDLRVVPWEQATLSAEDIEFLKDSYDETIIWVDELIGDFLDSLDPSIADKTIVVIFSDHGEMFARGGRFGRAGAIRGTFYDDVLHVPLMVKAPNLPPGRVDGLVQIIDVMPTLLDMLGIADISVRQGKNLEPIIFGEKTLNEYVFAGSDFNFSEHTAPYTTKSSSESIRNTVWKLIREADLSSVTRELYNLKNDPGEMKNVIAEYPDVADELTNKLNEWNAYVKNFR